MLEASDPNPNVFAAGFLKLARGEMRGELLGNTQGQFEAIYNSPITWLPISWACLPRGGRHPPRAPLQICACARLPATYCRSPNGLLS